MKIYFFLCDLCSSLYSLPRRARCRQRGTACPPWRVPHGRGESLAALRAATVDYRLVLQLDAEREGDDEQSLSSRATTPSRKGKTVPSGPSRKGKRKRSEDSDGDDPLLCFDPATLVEAKEGTFKVPPTMQKYLDKHMKRCLTKEEICG